MSNKIYFVLDRSGSMEPFAEKTLDGLHGFIKEQADNTTFTLNLFNDKISTIYSNVIKKNVRHLRKAVYRPNGGTALMDAIGHTIKMAEDVEPKQWADWNDDDTVTIVILTDGEENSSTEYKTDDIHNLIESKRMTGWKFVFLGANQDAFKVAEEICVNRESTLSFDMGVISSAISSVGSAVSRMISGKTPTVEFTDEERSQSQKI